MDTRYILYKMKGVFWICIPLFSFLLILGLWIIVFRPEIGTPSLSQKANHDPPQARLLGAHLIEMEGSRRVWEANADQIEVFEEEKVTRISKLQKQIQLILYQDDDLLTCYADAAEIDNKTREVELIGNLVALSREGISVLTDSVHWSPEKRRLFTDKQVTVRQHGLVIQGVGMEANLTLEEVKVLSNISSSFDTNNRFQGPSQWGVTH